MKFTVTIAKDGTPYFSVESTQPTDSAAGARAIADELVKAFADWDPDRVKADGRSGEQNKPNRFEVVDE